MDLQQCREQIDKIDQELVSLFCRRMAMAEEVAAYKIANHLPVLQPDREAQVLDKVEALAGSLYGGAARELFLSIMEISKKRQRALIHPELELHDQVSASYTPPLYISPEEQLACQGVPGAFSQKACLSLFPNGKIHYYQSFEEVFRAIEDGICKYGILPIENSSAGSVVSVYDLMRKHQFSISRAVRVKVEHSLLCRPSVSLDDITDLYSHEQAISQCSNFLLEHPRIKVHTYSNTAAAAKLVAESTNNRFAAIASETCAELYGLQIIEKGIQNAGNNYPRFLCISKSMEITPDADKISLALSLPHKTGSLYHLLARIAAAGLNLTKLESRPIPDSDFEFLFYFDLEGKVAHPEVLRLLDELKSETMSFTFLGNYHEIR